jgi:hypothetical protein
MVAFTASEETGFLLTFSAGDRTVRAGCVSPFFRSMLGQMCTPQFTLPPAFQPLRGLSLITATLPLRLC